MELNHPLDGIASKIQRAEESINKLNIEIGRFLSSDPSPYHAIGGLNLNCTEYIFKAYAKSVPIRFSVIAGEVIHQLRSCFDHLVICLVFANGGNPTNLGSFEFPIRDTREKFEKACRKGKIKGVSKNATSLIEDAQPYNQTSPDDYILSIIHNLDIIDKHRLLITSSTVAQIGDTITVDTAEIDGLGNAVIVDLLPKKLFAVASEEGAEIHAFTLKEPHPGFKAYADFSAQIAIQQVSPRKVIPLLTGLTEMKDFTKSFVGRFISEF